MIHANSANDEERKARVSIRSSGAKYTYTPGNPASRKAAKKKAIKQALAIQHRTGKPAHL